MQSATNLAPPPFPSLDYTHNILTIRFQLLDRAKIGARAKTKSDQGRVETPPQLPHSFSVPLVLDFLHCPQFVLAGYLPRKMLSTVGSITTGSWASKLLVENKV